MLTDPRGADGAVAAACLFLSAFKNAHPGDGWVGDGANGSTRRQQMKSRRLPSPKFTCAGWVGSLSSAAPALMAQPLRLPHRTPSLRQWPLGALLPNRQAAAKHDAANATAALSSPDRPCSRQPSTRLPCIQRSPSLPVSETPPPNILRRRRRQPGHTSGFDPARQNHDSQ